MLSVPELLVFQLHYLPEKMAPQLPVYKNKPFLFHRETLVLVSILKTVIKRLLRR